MSPFTDARRYAFTTRYFEIRAAMRHAAPLFRRHFDRRDALRHHAHGHAASFITLMLLILIFDADRRQFATADGYFACFDALRFI